MESEIEQQAGARGEQKSGRRRDRSNYRVDKGALNGPCVLRPADRLECPVYAVPCVNGSNRDM